MKARPLLAAFEVSDVVEGYAGRLCEAFLRPAALGAAAAKRIAEQDCLRRFFLVALLRRHVCPLTFHTIVGKLNTNDRGYCKDT